MQRVQARTSKRSFFNEFPNICKSDENHLTQRLHGISCAMSKKLIPELVTRLEKELEELRKSKSKSPAVEQIIAAKEQLITVLKDFVKKTG